MHDYHKFIREQIKKKPEFQRECCRDINNLQYSVKDNNVYDKVVLRCRHCHKLHYHMLGESAHIGARVGR